MKKIFIVDESQSDRNLLTASFSTSGYDAICFADGQALIAATRKKSPLCILLGIGTPMKAGLDFNLLRKFREYPAPVLMMVYQPDVSIAVEAVRAGAFDVIAKPLQPDEIVQRINSSITAFLQQSRKIPPRDAGNLYLPGREPLTRREREVVELFVSGLSNKEAAQRLGISCRTVEDHKAHVIKKLGARNSADLIRIVIEGSI